MGHDPSCDVHLDEPLASPFHATVRYAGSGYMIEEFLAGGSLCERMHRHVLSDAEATHVIGQACDKIEFAN
jgi:pSer/pThr/pTyr-binding forkhead associated (FHA) protein